MRKWTRNGRLTASVLGAVLLTACGDDTRNPLAPTGPAGLRVTSTSSLDGGALASAGITEVGATLVGTTVFTVSRWGGKYSLAGGHVVEFDANAVCDPLTSSYGPGTWDAPCNATLAPITFTATSWTDASGHARVDFSPDVRFVPTSSAPSRVLLQLRDRAASDLTATVLYCPTVGSCVDESITDPTMRARPDAASGKVFRHVKHFSGYNVSTGRAMTADDAEAVSSDAETFE